MREGGKIDAIFMEKTNKTFPDFLLFFNIQIY